MKILKAWRSSQRQRRPGAKAAQRGSILLVVLWLVLLLTLLIASMRMISTQSAQTASLVQDTLRREQLIETALAQIVFDLIQNGERSVYATLNGPVETPLTVGETTVRVEVTDDLGKVDMNAAADDTILALLESAMPSTDATEILFQLRSAQAERPLLTMLELQSVFADTETYTALEPHITVHTGHSLPFAKHLAPDAPAALKDSALAESAMAIPQRSVDGRVLRIALVAQTGAQARARVFLTGSVTEPYWFYAKE